VSLVRESFGDFSLLRRPATERAAVPVHFAHATGFNAQTYAPLFKMLAPYVDLHAMDARGHGFSKASANPCLLRSWTPYVRDLESYVRTLSGPVVLCGHSLGGTVSLELAARAPELVAGLVLLDPVLPPPRLGWSLEILRVLHLTRRVPIAKAASKRRMDFPSKAAAVDNFEGKGAFRTWPRSWVESYVDGGTVRTEGGVRLSCDRRWEAQTFAVSTPRPYRFAEGLRCPTTLISRDPAGPPLTADARSAFIEARPAARVVVLDGATHFFPMEHPARVCDEIHRMAGHVRSELR